MYLDKEMGCWISYVVSYKSGVLQSDWLLSLFHMLGDMSLISAFRAEWCPCLAISNFTSYLLYRSFGAEFQDVPVVGSLLQSFIADVEDVLAPMHKAPSSVRGIGASWSVNGAFSTTAQVQ